MYYIAVLSLLPQNQRDRESLRMELRDLEGEVITEGFCFSLNKRTAPD